MGQLELSDEGTSSRDLLGLDDLASDDPQLVGAKAAALATARRAGLPVLDGFVLTTRAAERWRGGQPPAELEYQLRIAWCRLSAGRYAVVVRSSSPNEDTAASSMAGQFRSVLEVRTWSDLVAAVGEVIGSADGAPMAVLIQPFVQPAWGGVLFGADPVTGRHDRLVVAAVPGGPHDLVGGSVTGGQFSMSTHGRILETTDAVPDRVLSRTVRRALLRLARTAAHVFGGPQDIEWAIEDDGRLVLLQSRPITTVGDEARAEGPVFGPGPVAETFPVALSALEEDLWIPPLREGLRRALELLGAGPSRQLRASPVVITVVGRPAVDLDLLGLSPVRRSRLAVLDPRPPARRLVAAWRVGRLRAALPVLAQDVLDDVDAELRRVPKLDAVSPVELLRLLERSARMLTSLHGYEVLAGQLLATGTATPTAASRALIVLAEARVATPGASDETLVADNPVLLTLVPPAIGHEVVLPPAPSGAGSKGGHAGPAGASRAADLSATRREALRLRIRWVQELTSRAAEAVGQELVRRGALREAGTVRHLRLDDLRRALAGEILPMDQRVPTTSETPLPRAFRQAGEVIVPVVTTSDGHAGRGAGGGRGMGRVHSGTGGPPPAPGAVLVVQTLDPGLAALLPGLAGLVSETGSVLSHLAILAREYGVPAVVDLPGALQRFPEGSWVVVDGTTGEVTAVESEEWRAA